MLFGLGDRDAARILTDRLTPLCFRVALRMLSGDRAEAEDVAQEALVRLWRQVPDWRQGEARVSTWLYRVALNTALTFRRKALRRPTTGDLLTAQHLPAEDAEPLSPQAELLYQAIRRLPAADRAIFTLHLDGYDNEEIAAITGLTKNHVAVKLHRIKTALEKKLTERNHE